jgi:hypothetical protein
MSRSERTSEVGFTVDPEPEHFERIEDGQLVQELLEVLEDEDCRSILTATSEDALSAGELSDACQLPLSTTYRKLELLDDVDALAEHTRVRPSGKHTSEYRRLIDSVVVSLDRNGHTELQVSERNPDW